MGKVQNIKLLILRLVIIGSVNYQTPIYVLFLVVF